MRIRALALTALLALALPAAASDVEIASGSITAGLPTSLVASTPIDSFQFDVAEHVGKDITTVTTDNGELGYDLDIYFYDADNVFIVGCSTEAADEVCLVPEGAVTGEVSGYFGLDLDVSVVLAH